MRKTLILTAAWLLSSCANRSSSTSAPSTAPTRPVTALATFTARELPSAYQRLHDNPGWKWVLWSNKSLCVVDASTWTRTQIGDRVSCDWRMPRG